CKQQRIFWTFNLPYRKLAIKFRTLGKGQGDSLVIDIDTFVVTEGHTTLPMTLPLTLDLSNTATHPGQIQSLASQNQWTLEQKGVTSLSAMQLTVIFDTHALIIDKIELNPVSIGASQHGLPCSASGPMPLGLSRSNPTHFVPTGHF
ncbi:uncharacterized protein BJ212DRAFT_1492131, partial [Suillus subaureus]